MAHKSSRPRKKKPKTLTVKVPKEVKGKTLNISDTTKPGAGTHITSTSSTPGKPSKP
jgi:hypothetical protein